MLGQSHHFVSAATIVACTCTTTAQSGAFQVLRAANCVTDYLRRPKQLFARSQFGQTRRSVSTDTDGLFNASQQKLRPWPRRAASPAPALRSPARSQRSKAGCSSRDSRTSKPSRLCACRKSHNTKVAFRIKVSKMPTCHQKHSRADEQNCLPASLHRAPRNTCQRSRPL